jgi:hypothetical protein
MNRIYCTIVLIVSMTAACSVQDRDGMQFSRPTLKGTLLTHVPKWHQEIYHDEYYKFVFRHSGNADYPPGFFAYDIVRNRWLEVTDLSTEHAVLGRSPDFANVPLQSGPDFRALARSDYARLPLRTSGSIVFPDKIMFSSAIGLYRLDCTPEQNRKVPLTSFWVRKVDLDEIR